MKSVSVILSTYNGEQYLTALLDSLRSQTRQPDEVLVSDDASTDRTLEIVRSYIGKYGLTNWHIIDHERNVGWRANFKRGILSCSGDLVFPCDQDDIWDDRKIELMTAVMEENSNINVLACRVRPFYEGENEAYRADNAQKDGDLIKLLSLDGSDFLYTMRPGCAFCIRKDFARDIEPWWKETYPHDAALWRFAALTGSLGLYGRQLVSFRRHGDNASARGTLTRESRIADIDYYIDFFKQLRAYLRQKGILSDQRDSLTLDVDGWLSARRRLLIGETKRGDIRLISGGRRWYSTWRSPLVDLYFVLKPNGRLHA
jgi:glycosyltransferase involved in cell wall biosynthesis